MPAPSEQVPDPAPPSAETRRTAGRGGDPTNAGTTRTVGDVTLARPKIADGADMWHLARDSGVLDLNSSHSYLLWCRDFAATSLVARGPDTGLRGFVTGYVRPDRPDTLVIWQVAVAAAHRGRGLASAMLDALTASARDRGVHYAEASIKPGHAASQQLFLSLAARQDCPAEYGMLFDGSAFPDRQDGELIVRMGPLPPPTARR